MTSNARQWGYTVVELLISLAIAAMLLAGLHRFTSTAGNAWATSGDRSARLSSARHALNRMADAVADAERLLIPMTDLPGTALNESLRSQTFPESAPQTGSMRDTAVLALTLPAYQDIDLNGIADADNDADGRVDEDWPADISNDGEPGLRGFDDDGNGVTDVVFSPAADDDESADLAADEDSVDGVDGDGDGPVDEDPGADMNDDGAPGIAGVDDDGDGTIDEGNADDDDEDGVSDEDWLDAVVFYMNGDQLIERRAVPWDQNGDGQVTGRDFVESVLADGLARLSFERLSPSSAGQQTLVRIEVAMSDSHGDTVVIETLMRVGARR